MTYLFARGLGKHLLREAVASPENVNSAIEQFTYIGDINDEVARVKLSLFGAMVQEPLFDQLRAKEQLGYIVRFVHLALRGTITDEMLLI